MTQRRAAAADGLQGIFTRRRSEIFLHRTRSGRARPDPRKPRPLVSTRRPVSSPMDLATPDLPGDVRDGPDGGVGGSIKDLRARRVFSAPEFGIECFEGGSDKVGADREGSPLRSPLSTSRTGDEKGGGGGGGDIDMSQGLDSQSTPPDRVVFSEPCAMEGLEVDSSTPMAAGDVGPGQMASASGRSVDEGDFPEECTPPDSGAVLTEPRAVVGFEVERSGQDPAGDRFVDGGICRKETASTNLSRNRPGLVPCSRLKVFSTPTSHCYRRLLPFLMDLTKNGSSTLEIIPVKNHFKKAENTLKETQLTLSPASLPRGSAVESQKQPLASLPWYSAAASQKQHEASVDEISDQQEIEENQSSMIPASLPLDSAVASQKQPEVLVDEMQHEVSVEETSDQQEIEENRSSMIPASLPLDSAVSYQKQPEVLVDEISDQQEIEENRSFMDLSETNNLTSEDPASRCDEREPLPLMVYSSADNLLTCESELMCKSALSTVPREDLTVDELVGSMGNDSHLQPLPKISEKYSITSSISEADVKFLSGTPSAKQPGEYGFTGPTSVTSLKGILKRSRSECRGPCLCLDCASFRLHAERAFEFSKKQMQETEDVTMGLVKELSSLRKLVANSVVPIVNSDGYGILQLKQAQVQDVCRKAFEVEKVAKNYLKEMASDLNAHCRMNRFPRHKVTFAESIEAKGHN